MIICNTLEYTDKADTTSQPASQPAAFNGLMVWEVVIQPHTGKDADGCDVWMYTSVYIHT